MKNFSYTIKDPVGIHARPAGLLVKRASGFSSKITIKTDKGTADAKRLFSIMGLGVKTGVTVEVIVEGADEEHAAAELEKLFKETL